MSLPREMGWSLPHHQPDVWRRNWEHLTPFFAYPTDIRKVIYTTNAVESLNMSLRKVIKDARLVSQRRSCHVEAAVTWLWNTLRKEWTSCRCRTGKRLCNASPSCTATASP